VKAIIALVLLVIVGVVSLFVVSNHTTLNISPVKVIGESTPVSVTATNSHGVRHLAVWLEQNGTRYPLLEQHTTSKRVFLNRHEPPQTITFGAGRAKAPNLKEGKAKLTEAYTSRQTLVKQSQELQQKLQALVLDLLLLAKTDDEAKAIVQKFGIQQSGPAGAEGAPAEAPK